LTHDTLTPLPLDARWRCFTDTVMGGVSQAMLVREACAGRDALVLRGRVRTENNGGFVQMALDVAAPTADVRGLELDLAGAGHELGVHLRTTRLAAPWQAWRARVALAPDWRTLRLAWADFTPHRFSGTLRPAEIVRIGLVALAFEGRPFDAEVALARLAWWS
jgi:hypothetical protein